VGNVITKVGLRHFGSLRQALGPNCWMEFLTEVFIGN